MRYNSVRIRRSRLEVGPWAAQPGRSGILAAYGHGELSTGQGRRVGSYKRPATSPRHARLLLDNSAQRALPDLGEAAAKRTAK